MADREGLPPCERRSSGAALMRGARKRNAAERTEVPVGRHPPNYAFTGSARLLVASENTWRTESSYCTTAGRCGENWRTERDERSAGVIRRITALPSGSDCQSLLSPLPGQEVGCCRAAPATLQSFLAEHCRVNCRVWTSIVPEAAVREAIVNAVVHADYAQRGSSIRIAILTTGSRLTVPDFSCLG
jgi:hypothetical protein